MKAEAWIFGMATAFLVLVSPAYWFISRRLDRHVGPHDDDVAGRHGHHVPRLPRGQDGAASRRTARTARSRTVPASSASSRRTPGGRCGRPRRWASCLLDRRRRVVAVHHRHLPGHAGPRSAGSSSTTGASTRTDLVPARSEPRVTRSTARGARAFRRTPGQRLPWTDQIRTSHGESRHVHGRSTTAIRGRRRAVPWPGRRPWCWWASGSRRALPPPRRPGTLGRCRRALVQRQPRRPAAGAAAGDGGP